MSVLVVRLSVEELRVLENLATEVILRLSSQLEPESTTLRAPARLFPNAYPDDGERSAEFRRFTEADLVAAKTAHLRSLLSQLPASAPTDITIDPESATEWIMAINDIRLVLGAELESGEAESTAGARRRALDPARAGYLEWISALQDHLLSAFDEKADHRA